jgi:hypothetical protein
MSNGGPAALPGSNLTPSNERFAAWTREDFLHAVRTGKRPDGTAIDGRYMPWRAIGQSSDEELSALWYIFDHFLLRWARMDLSSLIYLSR